MRQPPESVVQGLKNVRSTLRVIWQPRAVQGTPILGAFGLVKEIPWEPRWEVWDTDSLGADYMVQRVQNPDGSYKEIGDWLAEHYRLINPERYDGDIGKMYAALVDAPQNFLREMADKDFDSFCEAVGSWYNDYGKPKVAVAKDIH